MRLNAINPADNPMEELLYCFGGDGDSGDSGSSNDDRPTTSPAQRGGLSSSAARDTSRDAERDRDIGSIGTGGGRDGGDDRDVFDMSRDYVSQSIASFQSPSVGVMATPSQAARGQAGFSGGGSDRSSMTSPADAASVSFPQAPDYSAVLGYDRPTTSPAQRGGLYSSALDASTRPTYSVEKALSNLMGGTTNVVNGVPVTPTFAPNLINQPLSVGGAFSMPYDSYQRSAQQMFGYGGLTASPYDPSRISFAGGQAARSYDPLGGEALSVFDMGRNAQDYADRSFLTRAGEAIGGRFGAPFVEQRAGFFDPATGVFRDVGGTTTLEKTSENPLQDAFANLIAGRFGSSVDTATYAPLVGGEEYQYSDVGGLLGMLADGPQMVPMSEIEARVAAMGGRDGGDNDGGTRQPLIIPDEPTEDGREPMQYPQLTPREYRYTPFTSNFYTIPSRFTQPRGLI